MEMEMEKRETLRIYPAAPLESVIVHGHQNQHEQQQSLLKTSPPSYDQATASGATPTGTTENGQTVVVIAPPNVGLPYGPHPMDVVCPFCRNYTRTRIRHKPSSRTHLIATLLCIFQLYCFVCLPYLIESCMKVNHYCGLCDNYLGTYDRN